MDFSIKVDAAAAISQVRGIKDNQLPFALARSLTMSAKDGQGKMIEELPEHFTLRTKWYMPQTPFGFKIKPATKRNFTSEIYSKAPWIVDFEEGAIRTPQGTAFAVPQPDVRRTKRGLITKGQKPKMILRRPIRPAIIMGAAIFWRATKRGPLKFLYALGHKATIKPRLKFQATIEKVVTDKFPDNFKKSFEDALKNAR